MARYRITAIDPGGAKKVEMVEAASLEAALERAEAGGAVALSATPVAAGAGRRRGDGALAGRFAREFAILLEARMTPDRALGALARSAADPALGELAASLAGELARGKGFSDALAARSDVFPAWFSGAAAAAEHAGALSKGLGELARDWDRREQIEGEVRNALVYPIILGIAAVGVLGFLSVGVLPQFEQTFEDAGLVIPPFTAGVFVAARWLAIGLPALVVACFLGTAVVGLVRRTPEGARAIDGLVLGLPLVGRAVRHVSAARFARTLALALDAGATGSDALKMARSAIGNRALAGRLDDALAEVRRGRDFGAAVAAAGVLPPVGVELLAASADAGALGPAARKLAELLEAQFERGTRRWLRLLEPLLILSAGLVIGLVVVSVFGALASAGQSAMDAAST